MPQSSDELRRKFMSNGIDTCERMIIEAGGIVHQGIIRLDAPEDMPKDVRDAVQFLIEEWDYTVEE